MRKSLIGVLVVAAMIVVGAPRARASRAELEISSGGVTQFFPLHQTDIGFTFEFGGEVFASGGWVISDPIADAIFQIGGFSQSQIDLNLDNLLSDVGVPLNVVCATSPCNRDPLTFTLSGTGFTTRFPFFDNFSSGNPMSVGMTTTQEAFWDASDGLFATTSRIPPVTIHGQGIAESVRGEAFGGGPAGPSPYSLTLRTTFRDSSVGGSAGSFGVLLGTVGPHVNNPSFEQLGGPLNSCGPGCSFRFGSIPGWTNNGSNSGQFYPSVGPHGIFDTFAPGDGDISAFSNGSTISQTAGAVVEGDIYHLTLEIGHRNDQGFAGTADLLVGGTKFMATGTTPAPGDWSTFTAKFTGTAADAGDPITIQLNAPGAVPGHSQGNFDSVDLTATPIPEPGTLLLFGTGLLLLGIIVYRKQTRAKAGNIDLIDVA